ncbi:MAG: AI-2E family transporter [Bacteroidales bacterium]|nr:AI-2E family transporter [Bacteroidales bacterium]
MKQVLKYAGYIALLAAIVFLIWRFWFFIVWVLIAAVISFIGHPVVRLLDKVHIKKWHIPHAVSTILSLFIIVLLIFALLAIFVPLIVKQAETISKIDVIQLTENLYGPLQWLDDKLHDFALIPEGQTLQDFMVTRVKSLVNLSNVTTIINNFFNTAGTVIVGFFSVLFIAFFFLKDENMFEEGLLLFVPEKHHTATRKVIVDSKGLLRRYFIGIALQLIGVMSIITIGLWIFGVENALLIGFFGGIMNLIPYLGPVIGSIIGITLGITSTLAFGSFNELLPVLLKLSGVFLVANFIDNNILVPLIYSNSVKAHPLEIFFIIIIGGSLAGIIGMLLAIPVYTVLRVIGREFFRKFRVVKKLTDTIN